MAEDTKNPFIPFLQALLERSGNVVGEVDQFLELLDAPVRLGPGMDATARAFGKAGAESTILSDITRDKEFTGNPVMGFLARLLGEEMVEPGGAGDIAKLAGAGAKGVAGLAAAMPPGFWDSFFKHMKKDNVIDASEIFEASSKPKIPVDEAAGFFDEEVDAVEELLDTIKLLKQDEVPDLNAIRQAEELIKKIEGGARQESAEEVFDNLSDFMRKEVNEFNFADKGVIDVGKSIEPEFINLLRKKQLKKDLSPKEQKEIKSLLDRWGGYLEGLHTEGGLEEAMYHAWEQGIKKDTAEAELLQESADDFLNRLLEEDNELAKLFSFFGPEGLD